MGQCCTGFKNLFRKNKTLPNAAIVINGRWKIGKQIGKGGYGKVFQVYDIDDHCEAYAMKTEDIRYDEDTGRLPQEARVMRLLAKNGVTNHVPQLFDDGRAGGPGMKTVQFMVMTLLGPSLAFLRRLCPYRTFTPGTIAIIGLQLMDILENLHKLGYIHRDIKPGNFMAGRREKKHEIFLIDFGMARDFLTPKGELRPPRLKPPFRGTPRYGPEKQGREEYGRHTDLWCLLNSLVELRTAQLPWDSATTRKSTVLAKNELVPQKWLQDVGPEFLSLYESFTSLHYDITPDYDSYRSILKEMMRRENVTEQSPMDWENGSPVFKRLSTKALIKAFRED